MFADDILMSLTNTRVALTNLLSPLDTFATFSGLTVNPSKSKSHVDQPSTIGAGNPTK